MAEINLTLNVDTKQMEGLLKEGLVSLPQDKIQEVLLEVVKNILNNKDSGILFVSGNGYYDKSYKPTELLKGLIEKAQTSSYIEELSNAIINYLKENYQEVIFNALVKSISELLFGPQKQIDFYTSIQTELYGNKQQIEERLNRHGI